PPLNVTLTASGDDAAFHWVLGDGTFADGATVHHVYAAGAFTATVTATRPDGTTAQATTAIRAVAVALTVPSSARYGRTAAFAGTVVPATAGEEVALLAAGRRVSATTTG